MLMTIRVRLAVVSSQICGNLTKFSEHSDSVQGYPRSSFLVPIESALCNLLLVTFDVYPASR